MASIMRTIAFSTLVGAAAPVVVPDTANAQTAVEVRPFVTCWIGTKFGEQPGQLIRGWICEPLLPMESSATASARAGTQEPQDATHPFAGVPDVDRKVQTGSLTGGR